MLRLEEIELKIRDAIFKGEHRAGERLIEADLVKKYKVSRTILREALRNLSSSGIIRYIPKKGHSVQKITGMDAKCLYDMLIVLEGYACEIAVPLLKKKEIKYLEALHEKMKVASRLHNFKEYRELNALFHGCFSKNSGNMILEETIKNLRNRLFIYRYVALIMPYHLDTYVAQHESVLHQVKRGDFEKTKLAMQKHLKTVQSYLIEAIRMI